MKLLDFLFILAVAAALFGFRYRRHILTAVHIWREFKKMQRQSLGARREKQVESAVETKDARLVRCARCGVWTPQANALNLRGKTFYCSAACVENAVEIA